MDDNRKLTKKQWQRSLVDIINRINKDATAPITDMEIKYPDLIKWNHDQRKRFLKDYIEIYKAVIKASESKSCK